MTRKKRILGEGGRIHHVLLALTILLIAVQPISSATSELFTRGVFGLVILGSMAAVYGRRKLFTLGLLLGVPTVGLIVADSSGVLGASSAASTAAVVGEGILGIAMMIFVCVVMLGGIYRRPVVTAESVSASLTVYLFLGTIWASAYTLVEHLAPGAFYGLSDGGITLARRELFYYSFVTLTTLGYGDIGPVNEVARALVITEAVVGQLYLVVLVASLVGMFLSQKSQPNIDG
jgi:hypothetical protein